LLWSASAVADVLDEPASLVVLDALDEGEEAALFIPPVLPAASLLVLPPVVVPDESVAPPVAPVVAVAESLVP